MTGRRDLGELGERLAARHLEAKGYRVVARNFRVREGEIDIVAERDGTLVFVEVRTRRGDSTGGAIESITPAKATRLVGLVDSYCQARSDAPAARRIDVVAIDFAPDGRLLSVQHVENAVEG